MIQLILITYLSGMAIRAIPFDSLPNCQDEVIRRNDMAFKLGGGRFVNAKELEYRCDYKNESFILDIEIAKRRQL